MFKSLSDIDENTKQELVASLAALLVGSGADDAIEGEKLEAVATASGNKLSGAYASLWAKVISTGGLDTYCAPPGSGGGGGGGGGAAAAAEVVVEEEPEEEEEAEIGGGTLFGGDDAAGGDY
mmetsp:Transcript_34856/g.39744  ORF Transcript_34856/g.39744 Transcript_34856/m.39744 type:complete len:122 (+) Transcript_34856:120-485(+)|eukprot:CAMPEP_0194140774 /NCGR_PEP_ID=MMETSP0152-20130528/10294_1 /TAXON_ID=1049557 /ORGANISM="Thalassiothrix antarctica, Strain L6-D1" /LENGTH=121 /DNA_ID=CAMNT_0038839173 /DNA_START=172 /DNA_END=537 /DNA_ORIENTATION=+